MTPPRRHHAIVGRGWESACTCSCNFSTGGILFAPTRMAMLVKISLQLLVRLNLVCVIMINILIDLCFVWKSDCMNDQMFTFFKDSNNWTIHQELYHSLPLTISVWGVNDGVKYLLREGGPDYSLDRISYFPVSKRQHFGHNLGVITVANNC